MRNAQVFVKHSVTLILVKECDYMGTASAISTLLKNDSEVSRIGGNAARSLRESNIISENTQVLDKIVRGNMNG